LTIGDETILKLFDLVLMLSKETAIKAHEYIETHTRIVGYSKYPMKNNVFSKDEPEFLECRLKIPFLLYEIPKYELKEFPKDRIQYGAIFDGYAEDRINVTTLEGYDELYDYINNNPELKSKMIEEDKPDSLKFRIKNMVSGIVERYMYDINATRTVPEDFEDKLRTFVKEKILRYIEPTLNIDIYVPICLATFENEIIKLSEQIEIIRIPDDIQKSRQQACSYEANKEDYVAACATHMIVLHNYHFVNEKYISISDATRNYHAYPLHVIDNIMAVIRVVTGYQIGYEQILASPLNWIDGFCADLKPLYGAKSQFVNAKEIDKMWMLLTVNKVSQIQEYEIRKIYDIVQSCENDNKKGNISFALKRLNRCMLRDENDDMAIDATIGLEALLAGGTKGEITYTISNRIPVVFTHVRNEFYTPKSSRSIMKKIYNYRSKTVHGEKIKEKDMYHEINGTKVEIEKIAVDFLRYTLLFVLHNPEYLDAKKFDEFIDFTVSQGNLCNASGNQNYENSVSKC
jgi:hypothetical protein